MSKISIETLPALDTKINKSERRFASNFKSQISVTLQPTKNEYQNFGVVQTQDAIDTVLLSRRIRRLNMQPINASRSFNRQFACVYT